MKTSSFFVILFFSSLLLACSQKQEEAAAKSPALKVEDSSGFLEEYEKLEKAAMAGDYQAQRNLAYWLSGGNGGKPAQNSVLACAWRLVILQSGDPQVDSSDVGNKQLYCDKKLAAEEIKAAEAQAQKLRQLLKK